MATGTRIGTALGLAALALAIGAILLTESCWTLGIFRVECLDDAPCEIPGIVADGDTAVLIVHGMGIHRPGYSEQLVRGISEDQDLSRAGESTRHEIKDPDSGFSYGWVTRQGYRTPAGQAVTFFELTWSPTTEAIKQTYLSFDWADDVVRDRVAFNASLKKELIDEKLSDPVLYVGRYRSTMQVPIEQGICWMLRDSLEGETCTLDSPVPPAARERQFALISHSLGSRMVFDTVVRMFHESLEGDPAAATGLESLLVRLRGVYMLANQLPLLELGDIAEPPDPSMFVLEHGEVGEGLHGLLAIRDEVVGMQPGAGEEESTTAPSLWVVAFSDPNDLLSYRIPDLIAEAYPQHRFANVTVSVARKALLGKLAWPMTAHTAHDQRPEVIRLLARGASVP